MILQIHYHLLIYESKYIVPEQLQLRQWGAGNVFLLELSSWKVNIAENPIAIMGL